jgi:hypothetical protein
VCGAFFFLQRKIKIIKKKKKIPKRWRTGSFAYEKPPAPGQSVRQVAPPAARRGKENRPATPGFSTFASSLSGGNNVRCRLWDTHTPTCQQSTFGAFYFYSFSFDSGAELFLDVFMMTVAGQPTFGHFYNFFKHFAVWNYLN